MKCPYCLNTKTRVLDKRDIVELDVIRRRRECQKCRKRFTTYERIELVGFSVVKKDGGRERFDREKRPIPRENVERIVNEIEAELKNYEEKEVESSAIGQIVMERLKDLDRVAYIRFASVYRDFQDIQSFEKELRELKRSKKT